MPAGFEEGGDFLARFLREKGKALEEAAPPRLWEPGRVVGEWRVTAFLARGGSSEAYCARHVRLGTPAVLKVLWRAEEAPRARFARETAFLMGAPDPSFPAFYGTGEEDGRPWMALEALGEAPLPEKDADVARYLSDVARAVSVLHARGWVHRDLKPRNILVREPDGHAVLVDFGLLRPVGEGKEELASGSGISVVDGRAVGVGTPGYAAPEQFAGGEATPAADVYALGMLAEECFAGKPPRAWERIVRRATAALPRQRFRDVAAFLRAVRRRHWRRNALVAALVVAVAAAVALAGRTVADAPEDVAAKAEQERTAAVLRVEAGPGKEAVEGILRDLVPVPPPTGLYASEASRRRFRLGGGECLLARHEVTQAQWEAVMGSNPSRFEGADRPVDGVTFAECLEFAGRLNRMESVRAAGLAFRLPTRGEWEGAIAAGGGNPASPRPDELRAAGWFDGDSGGGTHPVGEKPANALGFCDLYGNVAECTFTPVWDGPENAKYVDTFMCVGGSCLTGPYAGAMEDFVRKLGGPFEALPGEFQVLLRDLPVHESNWSGEEPRPATALRGNLTGLRLCADRLP